MSLSEHYRTLSHPAFRVLVILNHTLEEFKKTFWYSSTEPTAVFRSGSSSSVNRRKRDTVACLINDSTPSPTIYKLCLLGRAKYLTRTSLLPYRTLTTTPRQNPPKSLIVTLIISLIFTIIPKQIQVIIIPIKMIKMNNPDLRKREERSCVVCLIFYIHYYYYIHARSLLFYSISIFCSLPLAL